MSIRSWSTTASANNAAPPNGWPEGQAPSSVNNVGRQMMAEIRDTLEGMPFFDWGDAPTRVDDDTFTVATNLTARYAANRRIKLVGATTGYATIESSSYSAPDTTVNVTMDSGNVPASLATVSLGPSSADAGAITPYFKITAAEIAAGATPANYAQQEFHVERYGGVFDNVTDDLAAWDLAIAVAAAAGGGRVIGRRGAISYVSDTVAVQFGGIDDYTTAHGIIIDLNKGAIRTDADVPVILVGASAASNSAYRGNGVVNGTIIGAGEGNLNNFGLVVRNHSFGKFSNLRISNCGAKAIYVVAYGRGNQYNTFITIEAKDNWRGALLLDCGSVNGGYVNDNNFIGIRGHENTRTGGGDSQVEWTGTATGEALNANALYRCAFETTATNDTLWLMTKGNRNVAYGLRLDGVSGSTKTFDIATGCSGNQLFGVDPDGDDGEDDSDNIITGSRGSSIFPYWRLGSVSLTGVSWDIAIQQPGSVKELHIGPNHANGIVRFPATSRVFVGNRSGGDNAGIELDAQNNRVVLRYQADEAEGLGPFLQFNGSASSSGNLGTGNLIQTNGVVKLTSLKLTAEGGIGVGNSALAATLGTVVRKMEVFNSTGASLGFVPIYNAIT